MPDRRVASAKIVLVLGIVALSTVVALAPLLVTLAVLAAPFYRLYDALTANNDADATTAKKKKRRMAEPTGPPALIRAHVLPPAAIGEDAPAVIDDSSMGILLKRSDDPHPAAVVVYHVVPGSYADKNTDLEAGCEVLAVNKHRIRGDVGRTTQMILYSLKKYGKVNLLCSLGERRSGSSYLVGKMTVGGASTAQSILQDAFEGTNDVVDGLELEETGAGRVRVVANANLKGSVFAGLKLNRGDVLYAIDGRAIATVADARAALMDAAGRNHVMVPMLTYNPFRRLRAAVMAMGTTFALGKDVGGSRKGEAKNIEDEYKVGEKLGEGAFAVVKKATHKTTGCTYAIKIINRASLNKDMDVALQDEISILRELDHEHIYKLDDVVVTINNYYLVTEYLDGGELFDRIVEKSSYTESEARDVCRILFSALDYMHSKGIAHRDLKPENLLLQTRDDDSQIKIADFGFAKAADGDESLRTMCGTPGYVAPEILRRERYGTKADLFSMGVIVFIMIGGYPPFYADNQKELLRKTRLGKYEFDRDYWGDVSEGAKDMIKSLLMVKPRRRPSAGDILLHPWMTEDTHKLICMNLRKSQAELKKYLARMRFKKAIHSILFVNNFTGENAVFSGANKRKTVEALEAGIEELGVEIEF